MGRGQAASYGLIEVAHRSKLLELARWRAQLERRSAELKMLYQLLLREPQAFATQYFQKLKVSKYLLFRFNCTIDDIYLIKWDTIFF